MIRIERGDTIIDILWKIKEENWDDVILAFPFWHPILHNYLSLKIIKSRVGEKKLLIITSDQTSRKIGKHLGIKYSFIKDDKAYEEASTKEKIMKHNFWFWEYFIFEIKHFFKDSWETLTESKNVKYYSLKYAKDQGTIGYFVFWLFISALTLFLIFYFAVTKTYISITPEINIKTRGKNFVFREMPEEVMTIKDNLIQLRKVSKTVYLEDTFATTGIDEFKIERSSGQIRILNYLLEDVKLFPKTRFQTSTGVILEIASWVDIPSAIQTSQWVKPSSVEVKAISQAKNSFGKVIGAWANISKDIDLILPWLKNDRDKIIWRTITDFSGAADFKQDFVLWENDIENAKKVLEEKLKSEAIKKLREEIKKENEVNNVTFEILGVDDIISYSEFNVKSLQDLEIWQKVKSFKLWGTIKIDTYIYNKDSIISKLKTVVTDSIIEWSEKLLLINNDSLRASTIIYEQKDPFEIKATMEIEAFIIHNFLNENDAYVKKLKNTIMWLKKDEAQKILLNDPKISNAQIDITPFFVKKVSSLPNNIILKIEENIVQ